MKIFIVDYLGIHCGMHYYLQSFKSLLLGRRDNNVEILSNFSDERGRIFFRNQYSGNILSKIYSLIYNYITLRRFVKNNKNDCFIFLSYGNLLEIPFFYILAPIKKSIIDVHEVIAQDKDHNPLHLRLFETIYKQRIKSVILHSERSRSFVKKNGFAGDILYVPHVNYSIQKNINKDCLSHDILDAIKEDKKNILFFGNLNFNKGIDILIDAINKLDDIEKNQIHVVIAGKNFDDSVYTVKPINPSLFSFLIRHIEDNELIYLYENTDFVAMPYRKTSQSGVLEMAFYFKKPVIASCIPYFKQVLSKFPSFGIISEDSCSDTNYYNVIKQAIKSHDIFFSDDDYSRYMNRPEFAEFLEDFNKWINN